MSEVEVKDVEIKTFPEKNKKKKKKKRGSAGRFFATFFITLFAFCGVGVVALILANEQLNFTLPGNWFSGHWNSPPDNPGTTYGLVKESEPVTDSYFDDAVFIGDSLTHGMTAYPNKVGQIYGVTGISVSDALMRDRYTLSNGRMGTAVDVAGECNPGKVYLMFGTNGVNYMTDYTPIIEDYTIMVQHIRQKCPDAVIYIQSIPPVTEGYSIAYPKLKPENIRKYNELLKKMAEKEQCYYLDSYSVLSTESGHLPRMYTSDSGLHINNDAYDAMFDYIKRHTVAK